MKYNYYSIKYLKDKEGLDYMGKVNITDEELLEMKYNL
jgi:hypothetical protein